MRFNPLVQMTLAKVRELIREPEMIFWTVVFPLLLALALGIAFSGRESEVLPIGVQVGDGAEWTLGALTAEPLLDADLLTPEQARHDLRTGRVALVVLPGAEWTYWFDPTRPESRLARLAVDDALQRASGRADARATSTREMTEKGSRYIDFLIPGLLGMNLMGTGMWGVGFYIVNARQKQRLKRLIATPMRKSEFLLSQVAGRLVFLVFEVVILVVFAHWVFGVPFRSSLFSFGLVTVLGAVTFSGLGLLVASRARTIEGVSGLMNLVMMPMWIMSGIFFSTARFPDMLQPIVQALPLTAVNDALRALMIDGASLADIWTELAISGGWCVATIGGALVLFRWR